MSVKLAKRLSEYCVFEMKMIHLMKLIENAVNVQMTPDKIYLPIFDREYWPELFEIEFNLHYNCDRYEDEVDNLIETSCKEILYHRISGRYYRILNQFFILNIYYEHKE